MHGLPWLAPAAMGLAIALPCALGHATVPDTMFVQEWGASVGWLLVLAVAAAGAWPPQALTPGAASRRLAVAVVLAAMIGAAVGQAGRGQGIDALVLSLGLAVFLAACRWGPSSQADLLRGLRWAGLLTALSATLQLVVPGLIPEPWLAPSPPGRVISNLRQPNQAAMMLAWAMAAGVLRLRSSSGWRQGLALLGLAWMGAVMAATASRFGLLALLGVTAWALLDRGLDRRRRALGLVMPAAYAACFLVLSVTGTAAPPPAQASAAVPASPSPYLGAVRLQGEGDLSSQRLDAWKATLHLIEDQPWQGVGWGQFGAAWSLSPLPERPASRFNHAHNLPLHLAAELGVPAALLLLGLLAWALLAPARDALGDMEGRAVLLMLLLVTGYGLVEHPFQFTYFLLPSLWMAGLLVAGRVTSPAGAALAGSGAGRRPWMAAAILGLGIAMAVRADHGRVEALAGRLSADALDQAIPRAQASLLFGLHGDYAAVMRRGAKPPPEAFHRALSGVVTVPFLKAYAESLHRAGRVEDARYVAQRLREIPRAEAQALFDACAPASRAAGFHCETVPAAGDWRRLTGR